MYVDESVRSARYLLTGVVVPAGRVAEVARAVREALPRGQQQRAHLSRESDRRRRPILRAYVGLGVRAVVAVTEVASRDQERAHGRCLEALVDQLAGERVEVMVLDSRQEPRDGADRRLLAAAVGSGRAPAALSYRHQGFRRGSRCCGCPTRSAGRTASAVSGGR